MSMDMFLSRDMSFYIWMDMSLYMSLDMSQYICADMSQYICADMSLCMSPETTGGRARVHETFPECTVGSPSIANPQGGGAPTRFRIRRMRAPLDAGACLAGVQPA